MTGTLYYLIGRTAFKELEKTLLSPTSGLTQVCAHTHMLNKGGMDWISDTPHSRARHLRSGHNPVDYDRMTLAANFQILYCKISFLKLLSSYI